MASYLPKGNGALRDWTGNFSSQIAADPSRYGLGAAEGQAIAQAVAAFGAAYSQARDPATRTKATLDAQMRSKSAMVQLVRRYAQLIKANPAVGADLKVNLGLRRDAQTHTPVASPTGQPVLHLVSATPLRHVLRYCDATTPDSRAKPANVVGLQLFCHVGSAAPAHPLDARFERLVTRTPHRVDFTQVQKGQTAFYYGRWQNATGATGPWSQVMAMTIAG